MALTCKTKCPQDYATTQKKKCNDLSHHSIKINPLFHIVSIIWKRSIFILPGCSTHRGNKPHKQLK